MVNLLENLNGKMIAVTGASGYIGSALVNALTKYSSEILCVSRKDLESISGMKFIKADVRSLDSWLEIVAQADIIFHLAGNTSVYAAEKNPVESLNSTLLPITLLIKAAQELGCQPRVVFASTATVYGMTETFPVNETTKPNPITIYDLHKLFAEQQLKLATKEGLIDSVSLRLANVYGPSSSVSSADDRGILNRVTAMAMQGKDLIVYGDGNYLRDYIYIDDVVNAFLNASIVPDIGGREFIVASGSSQTVKQAFEMVIEQVAMITDHRVNLDCVPWPSGANAIEHRNFIASNASIVSELGCQTTINFEEGIKLLISAHQK